MQAGECSTPKLALGGGRLTLGYVGTPARSQRSVLNGDIGNPRANRDEDATKRRASK
jgi:hypothetical protein